MLNFINYIVNAIEALMAHSLRSFLTSLGIIIAVAGVICIIAIGEGLNASLTKNFRSMGSETILIKQNVFKRFSDKPYQAVTENEWHALNNQLSGSSPVAAFTRFTVGNFSLSGIEIRYQDKLHFGHMLATSPELPKFTGRPPIIGRYLASSDTHSKARLAVISEELAEKLSLPDNPIGQIIRVAEQSLEVIGVMPGKSRDIFGTSADVYISLGLAKQWSSKPLTIDLGFQIIDPSNSVSIVQQARQILRQVQATKPGDSDDFILEDASEIRAQSLDILKSVSLVLMLVAAIALVVGCIGIMNVMLASVAERTREIGLLRALGASKEHIKWRILTETILLTGSGAFLGVFLGLVLANIIAAGFEQIEQVFLSTSTIVVTLLFTAAIGLLCGALPAARAAKLTPVTALNKD